MRNFFITAGLDIIVILVSYYIFRNVISGPTRHRLYEKFLSSFTKFVIFIFLASVLVTAITALVLYKTQFIVYINIIAPSILSIFVGFIISTVPTRGMGDDKKSKQ